MISSQVLTKKKQILKRYIKIQAQAPLISKGNWKFGILLVKIFSLKEQKKSKSFASCYYRKNQILSYQEKSLMLLQTIAFTFV